MLLAVVPALVALLLVLPATAHAQIVQDAAQGLRDDRVYVHPAVESALTRGELRELRDRIEESPGEPIRIAVLPPTAVDQSGGSVEATLVKLAGRIRDEPGIYAVAVPGVGVAAGTSVLGGHKGVDDAAQRAYAANDGDVGPLLIDFVSDVSTLTPSDAAQAAQARADAASSASSSDGAGIGIAAVVLLATGALLFAGALYLGRARRRMQDRNFEEARENALDDVVAFGDDVRALDLELDAAGAPAAATDDYSRALASYERAERAWKAAASPEELEPVSCALEAGRWELASAKARLARDEPPLRRPPCFFDPRHGPSSRDVEWSPPYGGARLVPACEADAERVECGDDPRAKQVLVGGRRVPYWNAGRAYGPFASGFFGGSAAGLLPSILVGSMLGMALGASADADDALGADAEFGGDLGGVGGDF